jgi:hypothetical protein
VSEPAREALKDRNQLYRHYRVAKTAEHEELFALPEYGDRLRRFNATLGHFGIADSGRMVAYVRDQNYTWLRNAPEDIRFAALQMVGQRIVRIRAKAGLVPFDDPLPHEPDDVFQLCRRELS